MKREPSIRLRERWAGPTGQVIGMGPPEPRALILLATRIRRRRKNAADRGDRQLHTASRLTREVKQPPVDHRLGAKRDVGSGLLGVGVELGPGCAKARRQRDHTEVRLLRRRSARDVDANTAQAVARRSAELFRISAIRPVI